MGIWAKIYKHSFLRSIDCKRSQLFKGLIKNAAVVGVVEWGNISIDYMMDLGNGLLARCPRLDMFKPCKFDFT